MRLSRIVFTVFFMLMMVGKALPQLCQGSLGDPVVNITFGAGANPGQPLAAGVTNYNYVSNTCPNDGQYTIANSTASCFSGSWFSVPQDHTPNDNNGYMMIVNASNAPGEFYVDTVRGLCGNTTYEFASWILNVLNAATASCSGIISPNVTFRIETTTGVVLQTFQTGNIPSVSANSWTQYGFNFATPSNTSAIVLRMTNNAPGGCGNDLIIDDITFRPCGPKATIAINDGSSSKNICIGDTTTIPLMGAISTGFTDPYYQWQVSVNGGTSWADIAGATNLVYNRKPTPLGTYLYRFTVAEAANIGITTCRINSTTINIVVHALPTTTIVTNSPVCEGDTLKLAANNGTIYQWVGPLAFTNSTASPTIYNASRANAGAYYVQVSDAVGCATIDSVLVAVNISPTANAGADVKICSGDSIQLQGSGGVNFKWMPATALSAANVAMPVAMPLDSTLYILTVSNGTCSDTDSILVAVIKKPTANAGPDQQIFQGGQATLQGNFTGAGATFSWVPDYNITTATTLQPTVYPQSDTTYTLHVDSQDGCGAAEDKVFVRVFKKLVIPNVFSPNGDGINDDWRIDGLITFPEMEMKVFDRFGRQVYDTRGYAIPWNGKYQSEDLPTGTYYYIIDLKNGIKKQMGSVTILR